MGFARLNQLRFIACALGAVAGAVVVLGAVGVYTFTGSKTIDSLAVLPFINAGGDPNTEYLSDGITESLITGLSRVPHLKVKSRDTVFRYQGQDKDVQEVGRELGVRAVLKGRLVQRVDSLSIRAELVDTSDGTVLWREQYNRNVTDILAIEQEISNEISQQLRLRLTGEELQGVAGSSTQSPEAHKLYLQGLYHRNRLTEEALNKSTEYLQQAIEKDLGYARAWVGLADSYVVLAMFSWMPPATAYPRARAAATRAIEMDETLGGSLEVVATIQQFVNLLLRVGRRPAFRLLPFAYRLLARVGVSSQHTWVDARARRRLRSTASTFTRTVAPGPADASLRVHRSPTPRSTSSNSTRTSRSTSTLGCTILTRRSIRPTRCWRNTRISRRAGANTTERSRSGTPS